MTRLFNYFRVEFHDSATSSGFDHIYDGMALSEPLDYRRYSLNYNGQLTFINCTLDQDSSRIPLFTCAHVMYSNSC